MARARLMLGQAPKSEKYLMKVVNNTKPVEFHERETENPESSPAKKRKRFLNHTDNEHKREARLLLHKGQDNNVEKILFFR